MSSRGFVSLEGAVSKDFRSILWELLPVVCIENDVGTATVPKTILKMIEREFFSNGLSDELNQ